MSLYKLSRLSGIPYSTLTNNLKHDAQMSVANLELICKALGISMSDFFNESGNMTETHVGRDKPYRRFHISNLLKPLIAYLRLLTFSRRFPRNAKYAILSI